MIVASKEILKELNLAMKHFRNAVKKAKANLVVGEINFQTPKPIKTRKPKTAPKSIDDGKETE